MCFLNLSRAHINTYTPSPAFLDLGQGDKVWVLSSSPTPCLVGGVGGGVAQSAPLSHSIEVCKGRGNRVVTRPGKIPVIRSPCRC